MGKYYFDIASSPSSSLLVAFPQSNEVACHQPLYHLTSNEAWYTSCKEYNTGEVEMLA